MADEPQLPPPDTATPPPLLPLPLMQIDVRSIEVPFQIVPAATTPLQPLNTPPPITVHHASFGMLNSVERLYALTVDSYTPSSHPTI